MIRTINSFDEYRGFISAFADDKIYSDPHFTYDQNNLYGALQRKDQFPFAVIKDGKISGIFVFLIIPDEKYLEMMIGFTDDGETFDEMLSYLEAKYSGFKADFVINPQNSAIKRQLESRGAVFDPEQQKMLHNGILPDVFTGNIQLYSDKWQKQYIDIHTKDTYWTAQRILEAKDTFRVLIAVNGDELVGYLDVTNNPDQNEPYDLYVIPGASRRDIASALLCKAIELNPTRKMTVLIDTDASEDIEIYTSVGFEKVPGQNSVYASYSFPESH